MAIPALNILILPSKNKFKFNDYDLYDDARCGYNFYNKCVPFLYYVSVEEDSYDDKDLPNSMLGYCRRVNETVYNAYKLLLSISSDIDQLLIDGLRNELQKI